MLEWSYSGVNCSLPGNGGPECLAFISTNQKLLETSVVATVSLAVAYRCYRSMPDTPHKQVKANQLITRLLLFMTTLTIGVELGFKLASEQVIFILNPCHLLSFLQIYLLIVPNTRRNEKLFRYHFYALHGATIALILPVLNTRLNQLEVEVYFIQHTLLLIVPVFLVLSGTYSLPAVSDLTCCFFTCSIYFIYHWIFLQALALYTGINLNNMLCPAISDPFYGTNYRKYACAHQLTAIIGQGVLFNLLLTTIANYIGVDKNNHSKAVKDGLSKNS